MLLEAGWMLPITGPALACGGVLVRDGCIEAVGPAAELRARYEGEPVRSFPTCVLMPGLVDAHTHLEYSVFRGFSPPCGFGAWMLRLLRARRTLSTDDYALSARWGAQECVHSGITCIADTSFGGLTTMRAAAEAGLRGRVYLEVFGLDDGRLPTTMERVEAQLARLRADRTSLLEVGLSPHATYSVSKRLYRELARHAGREGLFLATHVAESSAEVELLGKGSGAIAQAYRAAHLWKGWHWEPPRLRPVAYLDAAGILGPTLLAVHCVHVDAHDIESLARSDTAVAHCPRSNARLRCGTAPVADMVRSGVRVGLGTDSLASNDDLDMFAEMRAAMTASGADSSDRLPSLTPDQVLRLATIDGARALGLGHLVGSIEVGKRADLVAVRLAEAEESVAVGRQGLGLESVLVSQATAADVELTMVDGTVIFDRSRVQSAHAADLQLSLDDIRNKLGLPSLTLDLR